MVVYEKASVQHCKKERQKAKELRQSQWWKAIIAKGLCHYCEKSMAAKDLTMDHKIPISRGGRSTKGNVVPCCKACNSQKKYYTPAEIILENLS